MQHTHDAPFRPLSARSRSELLQERHRHTQAFVSTNLSKTAELHSSKQLIVDSAIGTSSVFKFSDSLQLSSRLASFRPTLDSRSGKCASEATAKVPRPNMQGVDGVGCVSNVQKPLLPQKARAIRPLSASIASTERGYGAHRRHPKTGPFNVFNVPPDVLFPSDSGIVFSCFAKDGLYKPDTPRPHSGSVGKSAKTAAHAVGEGTQSRKGRPSSAPSSHSSTTATMSAAATRQCVMEQFKFLTALHSGINSYTSVLTAFADGSTGVFSPRHPVQHALLKAFTSPTDAYGDGSRSVPLLPEEPERDIVVEIGKKPAVHTSMSNAKKGEEESLETDSQADAAPSAVLPRSPRRPSTTVDQYYFAKSSVALTAQHQATHRCGGSEGSRPAAASTTPRVNADAAPFVVPAFSAVVRADMRTISSPKNIAADVPMQSPLSTTTTRDPRGDIASSTAPFTPPMHLLEATALGNSTATRRPAPPLSHSSARPSLAGPPSPSRNPSNLHKTHPQDDAADQRSKVQMLTTLMGSASDDDEVEARMVANSITIFKRLVPPAQGGLTSKQLPVTSLRMALLQSEDNGALLA